MGPKSGLFGKKFCWEIQSLVSNISNQTAERMAPGEWQKEHNLSAEENRIYFTLVVYDAYH